MYGASFAIRVLLYLPLDRGEQLNAPASALARQNGNRFTYPGGMEG